MLFSENLFLLIIFLETKVLKYIFWGSNFQAPPCFEMYFLREHFLSSPMFWNAFFEGAIIFNFLIHGYWLAWLLLYIFMDTD